MSGERMNELESMTFDEGVDYMKDLCSRNRGGQQRKFTVFPNLEVCYPGGKKHGDYLLTVSGKVLKHSAVCVIIASYVLNGTLSYEEMLGLLEDVYANGWQHREYDSTQIWFLKCVLYWTTLQEEINYPQSSGRYEGRRMSFKRYAEAVLSTRADSEVSLDYVMKRADYWKNATTPIVFPNPPSFYY